MVRLRSPQVARKASKKAPLPVFIAATLVVFFLSLSAADSIGFVPYYIDGSTPLTTSDPDEISLTDLPQLGLPAQAGGSSVAPVAALVPTAFPQRISIASVGINLPVQNPSTTSVAALDALLTNGPARYSLSAKLGEKGNVIIFAHSSHLPIVHNKMYQAFNNIPEVKEGATIIILGSDAKEYIYSVTSVVRADTNDGFEIPLHVANGAQLTLVTCDTLTSKSARYILTADFIGTD